MMTTTVFSFGSNHPAQLAERLGHTVRTYPALLPDHWRVFRGWSERWNGGVASIVKQRGEAVYGLAFLASEHDLAILDRYEGVARGAYKRYSARGIVSGVPEKLVMYKALSVTRAEPSIDYLEAVAKTVGVHWVGKDGGPVTWRDINVR